MQDLVWTPVTSASLFCRKMAWEIPDTSSLVMDSECVLDGFGWFWVLDSIASTWHMVSEYQAEYSCWVGVGLLSRNMLDTGARMG